MILYPVAVPGYLIPFIKKEMSGVTVLDEKGEFTQIEVNPNSILGMFLTRRIRPSYKVKHYTLTIYSTRMSGKVAFSSEILEFQNSAQFRVDLTFEELDSFYKFLDCNFRMSFYFFVKGYCLGSNSQKKIKEAINLFCEHYDLLEYGYSEKQLRNRYNKMQKKGGIYKLQNNERISDLFL